jgi:hypothetical protein
MFLFFDVRESAAFLCVRLIRAGRLESSQVGGIVSSSRESGANIGEKHDVIRNYFFLVRFSCFIR